MKFGSAELKQLRWALAGLMLALVFGAAAVWASFSAMEKAQKERRSAVVERAESQGKLTRAASEEKELREKIAQFQTLVKRGHVGRENRLDWIEQITRIGRERKITELEYEFAPQKPVDALLLPSSTEAGKYHFMTSPQRLAVKLLHEGDLFVLLQDLRAASSALILVRDCSITRLPPKPDRRSLEPQLAAECQLDWVTLQEAT